MKYQVAVLLMTLIVASIAQSFRYTYCNRQCPRFPCDCLTVRRPCVSPVCPR